MTNHNFEEEYNIPDTFQINSFIELKLEDGKSNIYVKGKLFLGCKYLLIQILYDRVSDFDGINSIDDASKNLNHSLEEPDLYNISIPTKVEFWAHCSPASNLLDHSIHFNKIDIKPEVKFWGHSSNLQTWGEHDYDTRLLHRNLSFPLLKRLLFKHLFL